MKKCDLCPPIAIPSRRWNGAVSSAPAKVVTRLLSRGGRKIKNRTYAVRQRTTLNRISNCPGLRSCACGPLSLCCGISHSTSILLRFEKPSTNHRAAEAKPASWSKGGCNRYSIRREYRLAIVRGLEL